MGARAQIMEQLRDEDDRQSRAEPSRAEPNQTKHTHRHTPNIQRLLRLVRLLVDNLISIRGNY